MPDHALIIGINSYAHPGVPPLLGCLADADDVSELLTGSFGFAPASIRTLRNREATAAGIARGLEWLVDGATAGDRLYVHFSGHGSYKADLASAEPYGVDELLCPQDFDPADHATGIPVADLVARLRKVPEDVRVVAVLDCGYGGSGNGARGLVTNTPRFVPPANHDDARLAFVLPRPPSPAAAPTPDSLLLSACTAYQSASEIWVGAATRGALTFHLCQVLRQFPHIGRRALLQRIGYALHAAGVWQTPGYDATRPGGGLFGVWPRTPRVVPGAKT